MTIVRLGHSPYIEIREAGKSKSGVTRIWSIWNTRANEEIGFIRWHGPWRGYVFEAYDAGYYDEKCLKQVADFIIAANEDHKTK